MSYKFSFADNAKYSATDVNNITKRLVTSGIAESFENGIPYNVSRFNEAGQLLYTSGVVPESCLTLKVVKSTDGKIIINPGYAFFDDGSVIEIGDGGEELSYTKGVMNYVYLKNNLEAANVSYPCCSTEAPEGDYVMLAIVNENGVIFDKRTYAHGKLPGYQSVTEELMFLDEKVEVTVTERSIASGEASFDIGANRFKYMISIGKMDHYNEREYVSVYRIEDGKIVSFVKTATYDSFFDSEKMYFYYDRVRRQVNAIPSITDGVLKMKIELNDSRDGVGDVGEKISVDIKLIFI